VPPVWLPELSGPLPLAEALALAPFSLAHLGGDAPTLERPAVAVGPEGAGARPSSPSVLLLSGSGPAFCGPRPQRWRRVSSSRRCGGDGAPRVSVGRCKQQRCENHR